MLKQIAFLILVSIITIGCTNVNTQPDLNDPVFNMHPDWPNPVRPDNDKDWMIIEVNDKNYVGLEYDQYLDFLENQNDIARYIEQSNQVICFYRKELDESRCSIYNDRYNHSEGTKTNDD